MGATLTKPGKSPETSCNTHAAIGESSGASVGNFVETMTKAAKAAKADEAAKATAVELESDQLEKLPDGWEKADDGEGNTYYYNDTTRITQWERPSNYMGGNKKSKRSDKKSKRSDKKSKRSDKKSKRSKKSRKPRK